MFARLPIFLFCGLWLIGLVDAAEKPTANKKPTTSATTQTPSPPAPLTAVAGRGEPNTFVKDVQPLLAKHCIECHGSKKDESGLRLDSPTAILTGGYSGPAVVPGKSTESFLVQVVRGVGDLKAMPPDGKAKLTQAEIDLLVKWIDAGAVAPKEPAVAAKSDEKKPTEHWAFRPIGKVTPPKVKDVAWARNPIDSFILEKLVAAGLEPSPEADPATLCRRLHLDLTGLPPTPAEVQEFVHSYSITPSLHHSPTSKEVIELGSNRVMESEKVFVSLVDKLLASPHYGERWGRHWLDAARYADSNGYTIDSARSIWRYRDWVIDSLNADLPFDEFTIHQLAGDMLPQASQEQQIATGFHRNTLVNEEGGTDKEQFRVEAVVDRVSTVGNVWLGLSVGCARCHDHKYDPISQREFYQLFALLNNCEEPSLTFPTEYQAKEEPALLAEIETFEKRLADVAETSPGRRREWERIVRDEIKALEKAASSPEVLGLLAEFTAALDTPENQRTETQTKLIETKWYPNDVERSGLEKQLADLQKRLKQVQAKLTTTLVVKEMPKPRETYIHVRGDFLRKGAAVEPGTPAVFPTLKHAGDRATRLDLARWLVDGRNPLTARVTVNRVWQQYFGTGLVATENDFGTQGERPTHPELLDWLADQFMQGSGAEGQGSGKPWSLKSLHRLIVTSSTYRQASHMRPEVTAKDPYNKLLARQARIRLEAEVIRDVGLAVSGLLSPEVGGPSVYPPQPQGIYAFTQQKKFWPDVTGADRYRRGLYTYFWRSSPYPFLMTFDAPDANAACTRRIRSNTPLQALTLANDRSFVEMAGALARRILDESPSSDDAARAVTAFQICLARKPSAIELQRLVGFVNSQRPAGAARAKSQATDRNANDDEIAWAAAARVMLNLDEFITRE